ncbi:MAG: DegT/DnrJ/EryC1/StrS family aminotransferase, partial [Candidatus Thermoplasmatota archaeon]|nr:DegT/DnrJ/EryC1/StrS family aminotransferase [Candidatus Thermoplasmatota archaeon]
MKKGVKDQKQYPLARPYFDSVELDAIKEVLETGWVAQGPKGNVFEKTVAEYTGAKHAVAVSNCTAALHLALLSLGIRKGDEVLVADFTYPATGHSVVYCGAKPVFVDVDARTYNIDPEKAKELITDKTKAIIPVHTFGQPADMAPILELAEKNDIAVVEDAACALGAKYGSKFAGTMGKIGCFSFHARKGITTGEGGMVVTESKSVADLVRKLAVFGI